MTDSQSLSERELEVLRLVAQGATNQQIAHELSISSNTVKVHLRNIYSKLGVMSRTEATVQAVRRGLIVLASPVTPEIAELPTPAQNGAEDHKATSPAQAIEQAEAAAAPTLTVEQPAAADVVRVEPEPQRGHAAGEEQLRDDSAAQQASSVPQRRVSRRAVTSIAVLLALAIAVAAALWRTPPVEQGQQLVPPLGWDLRQPLPEPRADLAAVSTGGRLYAIGGEGPTGVSSAVWRYDPAHDRWEPMADKPLPVADVSAVLLGGEIYVPGGRTSTGELTAIVEVYDPQQDRWDTVAALPEPRSAYGLVELEGKIYLFGGRSPDGPSASVFIYDPATDAWSAGADMLVPLADLAAVASDADGLAYIVGGRSHEGPMTTTFRFTPGAAEPWQERATLPKPKLHATAVDLVGTIFLLGSDSPADAVLSYDMGSDEWETINLEHGQRLTRMAAVTVGRDVFVIGGWDGKQRLAENRIFRPLNRAWLPEVPNR